MVGFAPDEEGRPIFVFSGMSSHTVDILADPRCSVTIADKNFKGAADGRVNLMGTCERLKDEEEIAKAKEIYLQKHPGGEHIECCRQLDGYGLFQFFSYVSRSSRFDVAFWIEFGDFFFYRMEIEAIRFVGGFARAGTVTPEEYKAAKPDPIMAFGGAIAQHMNEDHMSATVAIAQSIVPGLEAQGYVKEAVISRVDSLGMDVKITRDPENDQQLPGQPKQFKVRLPFPFPVQERKDVKVAIMEMTNAAAASQEASK